MAVVKLLQILALNTDSGPKLETGVFVDAPANGLYYRTSSGETGFTGEDGEAGSYKYKAKDTVTFYLGGAKGLEIGSGAAKSFVMPQDIASPEIARNVARLLLSINEGRNDEGDVDVITIPDSFKNIEDKNDLEKINAIDLVHSRKTLFWMF